MMESTRLRLLIVDSCPVVSAGLSSIVDAREDMDIVSEVRCIDDAVARLRATKHDLIVMDFRNGYGDNCGAVRRLLCVARGAKILIFSAHDGDGEILRALNAGVAGYLLKSATSEEIVRTIQNVVARERYLPPDIAQRVAEFIGKESLTPRELEVLALVREGWRNRQIAHELRVAETTVNFHVKNTLAKLRANDRTHAVTIAMKRGLLPMVS